MATNAMPTQESTVRPNYILLGIDQTDVHHVYSTRAETVHLSTESDRVGRKQLWDTGQTVDDYVETVGDARGWADQRYGRDTFGEFLAQFK